VSPHSDFLETISGSMAQALANQDFINKLVKYLDTHNGRDKICRFLQYGSKFLGWWVMLHNNTDLAKKFSSLETSSSMARKVFRLAKSIAFFQTALKSWYTENDVVVKLTTVVQNVSLGLWLVYDHIVWATKLGLIKSNIEEHSRKSNIFWFISMVTAILRNLYLLQQTQQLFASGTHKQDTLESLRKRQSEYLLDLIRNFLDLPIPITALSKKASQIVPGGVVGLCGTVTSLIGVHQVWTKTK